MKTAMTSAEIVLSANFLFSIQVKPDLHMYVISNK